MVIYHGAIRRTIPSNKSQTETSPSDFDPPKTSMLEKVQRCNSWIKNNLIRVPENSCKFCCFLRSLVLGKVFKFLVGGFLLIPPWRLTWNIIMEVWKVIFLSKWMICRFHANLVGGRFNTLSSNANLYCLHWCESCILGPFLAAFSPHTLEMIWHAYGRCTLSEIRLMEEILQQLRYIKPCKNWDICHIAEFLPSTACTAMQPVNLE